MHTSYLLLRNNQQSGPYRLEELAQLSLKPKDLLWVVGQSAGWRYPEEIESLKTLIDPTACLPVAAATVTNSQPEETPVSDNGVSAPKKDAQPSSSHIYVSLPAKAATVPASTATQEEAPSLSFEERVEKMRQRAANVHAPAISDEEPEVDVKYSRSLEDIKAEYAAWMHTQKKKRSFTYSPKQIGLLTLLVTVVAGGYWAVRQFNTEASQPVMVKDNTATSVSINESTAAALAKPTGKPQLANKKGSAEKGTKKNKVSTPVLPTQVPVTAETPESTGVAETPGLPNASADDVTTAKTASVVEQLLLEAAYLPGQRQHKVNGLTVSLKNTSGQVMKVVAVDVIYFSEGMKEIDRKTLYFSNVEPGQTVNHNAPGHAKAEGAYAQLGLVSSEKGGIYYASNR